MCLITDKELNVLFKGSLAKTPLNTLLHCPVYFNNLGMILDGA